MTRSPDSAFASTLPAPMDLPLLPLASAVVPGLRLLVKGFNPMERRLLDGTVKLSQRRSPRLDLLDDAVAETADVVMVDARDADSMQWARRQAWLARKAVIWVDATTAPRGHTAARRPIQWPILPMLLARALEQGPQKSAEAHEPAAAAPVDPHASTSAPPMRPVLVVDDSLAVRAHLRSLLEARGITVAVADSAEAGIRAAAVAHYGCILMDVLMPGMDGYEACRRIKAAGSAERRRTTIVMLTSKASPFDRIRGKMAGCDAYLTKPVDPAQLHEVLAQFISVATVVPATAPAARTPLPRLAPSIPAPARNSFS